jgi:hypothetical protein
MRLITKVTFTTRDLDRLIISGASSFEMRLMNPYSPNLFFISDAPCMGVTALVSIVRS